MKLLTKFMDKLGYVPKEWLNNSNKERDKARKGLLLCEKMSQFLNKSEKLDKERLNRWSKTVREESKFTCDICGDKDESKLSAHHLYDKHTHPSLAYIPENGVCLCNSCHSAFHGRYTSKSHTTPKLYQKFKIIRQAELGL